MSANPTSIASAYDSLAEEVEKKKNKAFCKQPRPYHMMGSLYIRASNMSATHRPLH